MTLFIWIVVFIFSMVLLIKSADWLLDSSEKIGLKIGISPFVVGITIVAFGTSFPELVSSIFAVFKGAPEIVVATAVGSNIANILLIVGISVVVAKKLTVSKSLIDLDLPLVALSTAIFVLLAWDGMINIYEAVILLIGYGVYLISALVYKQDSDKVEQINPPDVKPIDMLLLFVGIIGLAIGAKYLIDSVVALSEMLKIATAVITLTAVAFGTSLPELVVSVKAAFKGKAEVALGNIFGSNVFNLFVVVGLPGLFIDLPVSEKTMMIGLPVLIVSTLLFIFSGISKRIHFQEGILYLLIYIIFVAKLFNLF